MDLCKEFQAYEQEGPSVIATDGASLALFLIDRFEWEKILEIAQCKILSSCSNNFLDAYLLRYMNLYVLEIS